MLEIKGRIIDKKKTPIVLATNLHKCYGPDKNNWDINLNKSISFSYNFRKL